MTRIILTGILSLFSFSVLNAQDAKKKEHYRLLNPMSEFSLNYEKALTRASFDTLRFVSQRRQIQIEGTTMSVELYSAKELQEIYKQPIHPLNITDASKAKKVKLKMNSYGLLDGVYANK